MNFIFSESTVTTVKPQTPHAKQITLRIENPKVSETYHTPGQYAVIRVAGFREGFFAMANSPGDNPPDDNPPDEKEWSFLIKESSPLAAHLVQMKPGDKLEVSNAQEKGFNMPLCRGKNVLLCAAGTGIAPIRAALLFMLNRRSDYGNITLLFGARNPAEFAYVDDFPLWKTQGVDVIQIVSNKSAPNWKDSQGYVRDFLPANLEPNKTIALLCGMKGMMEATINQLIVLGFSRQDILTNY